MSAALPQLGKTASRASTGTSHGGRSDEHDEKNALDSPDLEKTSGEKKDGAELGASGSVDSLAGLEEHTKNFPWRYKLPAALMVFLFTLGSNWAGSAISPLKSTIRKELKITNAQYGVISSADSLVNTILPIFSGIAIDYYGPEIGALVSSVFIFLGAIIAAVGASKSSFNTLVAGEVILGLGSTTIETSQSKLYTHWFYGKHLGLVFGIDIAWGRVTNTVSRVTSVPIMNGTGSWTWSFWVACIMCGATLALTVFYYIYAARLPVEYQTPTGSKAAKLAAARDRGASVASSKRKWSWMSIASVPAAFWIVALSQILQSGTVGSFNGLAADMIKQTRNTSDATAGYTSGTNQIIPIFLTPFLGFIFDRYGRRMYFVSATAALWVLVFALMGFTTVHALVPMVLSSVALAFNALPFIASIPLLVPNQATIGTAFGIWKSLNNAGSVIMDVSTGAIQDQSPTGRRTYDNVLYFLIALKAVDIGYGMLYHIIDTRYFGGVLKRNEAQQRQAEEEERLAGASEELNQRRKLRGPVRLLTLLGIGTLGAMIVVAWVLYLVYSQAN